MEWRLDRIGSTIAPFDLSGGTACYHAADLRAGLLNDDRVPEIVRAWRLEFRHGEPCRHRLHLPSGRLIDLAEEDLGALLQEERLLAKDAVEIPGFNEYVKLLSVSLTFGLLARTDRKTSDAPVSQQGYGPAGEDLCIETRHREELGPFSFLPAASAVCATARLAVASAKQVVEEDLGGSVAYISTDSLGIPASPTGGLLSFASEKGPPSRWFCQWHGTTPVASHGTTLSIHQHRPKTDSAGPAMPSRRRPHGVQGGKRGPDQRGAQTLAFRRG